MGVRITKDDVSNLVPTAQEVKALANNYVKKTTNTQYSVSSQAEIDAIPRFVESATTIVVNGTNTLNIQGFYGKAVLTIRGGGAPTPALVNINNVSCQLNLIGIWTQVSLTRCADVRVGSVSTTTTIGNLSINLSTVMLVPIALTITQFTLQSFAQLYLTGVIDSYIATGNETATIYLASSFTGELTGAYSTGTVIDQRDNSADTWERKIDPIDTYEGAGA